MGIEMNRVNTNTTAVITAINEIVRASALNDIYLSWWKWISPNPCGLSAARVYVYKNKNVGCVEPT
jgi:hypothetical protein